MAGFDSGCGAHRAMYRQETIPPVAPFHSAGIKRTGLKMLAAPGGVLGRARRQSMVIFAVKVIGR